MITARPKKFKVRLKKKERKRVEALRKLETDNNLDAVEAAPLLRMAKLRKIIANQPAYYESTRKAKEQLRLLESVDPMVLVTMEKLSRNEKAVNVRAESADAPKHMDAT